jgi:hypothetical protein
MRCIAPYFWLLTSPKARFTCFWFDRSKLSLSALAQSRNLLQALRACKGFHQSAASAKLSSELRLFIEPEKDFINRLRAPN